MTDKKTPPADPVSLDAINALILERAPHVQTRAAADAEVKRLSAIILATLQAQQLQAVRYQAPCGALCQIVAPPPGREIIAERLLEQGVSAAVIEKATILKPKQPFLRVDMPKTAEQQGEYDVQVAAADDTPVTLQ